MRTERSAFVGTRLGCPGINRSGRLDPIGLESPILEKTPTLCAKPTEQQQGRIEHHETQMGTALLHANLRVIPRNYRYRWIVCAFLLCVVHDLYEILTLHDSEERSGNMRFRCNRMVLARSLFSTVNSLVSKRLSLSLHFKS